MKQLNRKQLRTALGWLGAFLLWTAAIRWIDVRPIGPRGSAVGLSTLNGAFHSLTGVHWSLYHITDWLGLVPVGTMFAFTALGLAQWIRRKHLLKVDRSILTLGGFYAAVLAAYEFFEQCVINYRPVLVGGALEASYPSSTTLLVLTVVPTAAMQLKTRIRTPTLRRSVLSVLSAFTVFMVMGRLLSGVHWVTDIVGGILLSAGLVATYAAVCGPEPR